MSYHDRRKNRPVRSNRAVSFAYALVPIDASRVADCAMQQSCVNLILTMTKSRCRSQQVGNLLGATVVAEVLRYVMAIARDRGRRGWRLSAKLLVLSSLVTIVGFSAICASVMLDMRRGEGELARQTSENLASSIDADISRNIELFDLSLRNVVVNVVSPEINTVSRELRNLILFDHAASARHFGAIQVFDASGNLTIDAASFDPVKINAADEEFFAVHRDNPGVGLFISRPMLFRGAYSIVLSRRVFGREGEFLGVVAGAIRFSYFHDLFGRLQLGEDDVIAVMRRDGVIIMRTPFDLDVIGRNLSQSPLVQRALHEQSGSMSHVAMTDGVSRLYVWRDSSKPLVVLVGKPWTSIYQLWTTQAQRIGGIVLMLALFVAAVTLFLARETSRRADAEEKLEELANTDGLTGLRNRRKFDQVFELEWRRAVRQRTALALLMIDADHFKSYNDRFGHQAGDQLLVALSGCIAGSARRAGDCAARYGGEEFALLLPGASAAEALEIAEIIRRDVVALPAQQRVVSVSIGVAGLTPREGLHRSILLEAADKALYAAKAGGRNQARVTRLDQLALVA